MRNGVLILDQQKCVMKKLIFFFLLYSSVLYAQDISGTYKHYEGLIGKKAEIIVDLHIADTVVSGHYYYSNTGKEIRLSGSIHRNNLSLKELDDTVITGFFKGTASADLANIEGTWSDAVKSKNLPFRLTAFLPEGSVNIKSLTETLTYVWKTNSTGQSLGCSAKYTYCYLPEGSANPVTRAINEALLNIELEGDETPLMMKGLAAESMEDEFDSFTESYQETFPDSVAVDNKKYMDESPYTYNWQYQQVYDVIYNEHFLLTVKVSGYSYTGGAHGNTVYSYLVFDLKTGEVLSLESLFNKASKKELAAIAEKQLRINRNIDDNSSLEENGMFIRKLDLKDEFYIDHGGIGFTYNPYEIAPYAEGPINVYLRWEQIKSLINADGPIAWAIYQ